MAQQHSIFDSATFVANNFAAQEAGQQSRALSTLHFASAQESTDSSSQSQSVSASGDLEQSSKNVAFSSDAEKAV